MSTSFTSVHFASVHSASVHISAGAGFTPVVGGGPANQAHTQRRVNQTAEYRRRYGNAPPKAGRIRRSTAKSSAPRKLPTENPLAAAYKSKRVAAPTKSPVNVLGRHGRTVALRKRLGMPTKH